MKLCKIKYLYFFNYLIDGISCVSLLICCLKKYYLIIIILGILQMIKHLYIWIFLKKHIQFTRYFVYNNNLYKIYISPNKNKMLDDIEFRNQHEDWSMIKKFDGFLNFGIFQNDDYTSHILNNTYSILKAMYKLRDDKYLVKLINSKKFLSYMKIYKINKIYSCNFNNEINEYNLICDAIDLKNNDEYIKCDIILKNLWETNFEKEELIQYLDTNNLKQEILNEEKYENSVEYKKRRDKHKSNFIFTIILFLTVLVMFFIFVYLFSKGSL